jgi:hypothetical protein
MINQYGNWQETKQFLDNLNEPQITKSGDDWRHINVDLPKILGYPCQYSKHISKKDNKINSYATIMNPNTNSCYIKTFSGITEEEANDIFNN